MAAFEGRTLRFRIALFFALIGIAAFAGTAIAIAWLAMRLGEGSLDQLIVILGGFGLALTGLTTWIALKFDENLSKPIMAVAADLRMLAHADAKPTDLNSQTRYLGLLGPAARQISDALLAERARSKAEINAATADAAHQKEELEALLRDLRQGLIICTLTGRVTLYNNRAAEVLQVEALDRDGRASTDMVVGTLGLGRDFFNIVDPGPFERAVAAFERASDANNPLPINPLDPMPIVFSTRDGARTLRGHISPRLNITGNVANGFVLVFDDVTSELAEGLERDRLLQDVLDSLKCAVASENTADVHDAAHMAIRNLETASKNIIAGAWPMTDLSSAKIFSAIETLAARDGIKVKTADTCEVIHGDSATMIALLMLITRRLKKAGAEALNLSVDASGRARTIRLEAGAAMGLDDAWLSDTLQHNADETTAFLSGDEILERHRGEAWIEDSHVVLHFPVNTTAEAGTAPAMTTPVVSRPEFYDFNLFKRQFKRELFDVELDKLHCVVFDCEMTGLDPARDALVSVAGARVVNERVLKGELFDTYINPGRRIPAASTKIHHISDAMVADAPKTGRAVKCFHGFARDQVLVAHNAAFDMAFLERAEKASGVKFDNVVIDTVLLAAHLFGPTSDLTLDALAKRFDITIPPEARHTAIGDALATADVLVQLFKLLRADGVVTLRDAVAISEQQTAIRRRQKEYA